MNSSSVSVAIVTFNSAEVIAKCLQYVFEQDYPNLRVIVVDNASSDRTPDIVEQFRSRVSFIRNRENIGFAAGQNQAIAQSNSDWVLTLNPDVRLAPDFLTKGISAGERDAQIGSVSGKVLRMGSTFEIPTRRILDSTGIYFTPALRHFDRGSGEADSGQYDQPEYVFGVTGAAALYRRKMIEDVSVDGQFFDEDFFAYREDADLSWRAQLLGWKCLYAPDAVAYHVRKVLPSNRAALPAIINMHSVKNRFLMRVKNITPSLYARHFLPTTARDLLVFGGCLLREFSSLRAFSLVVKLFPKMLTRRKQIVTRRRVGEQYMLAWFSNRPVSRSATDVSATPSATAVTTR